MPSSLDYVILAPDPTIVSVLNVTIVPGVLCVWGPRIQTDMPGLIQDAYRALEAAQQLSSHCLLLMQKRMTSVMAYTREQMQIPRELCKPLQALQRKTFSLFQRFLGKKEPYSKEQFRADRHHNYFHVKVMLERANIDSKIAIGIAQINELPAMNSGSFQACWSSENIPSAYLNDLIIFPENGKGLDEREVAQFQESKKKLRRQLPPLEKTKEMGTVGSLKEVPRKPGLVSVVLPSTVQPHNPPENSQ